MYNEEGARYTVYKEEEHFTRCVMRREHVKNVI